MKIIRPISVTDSVLTASNIVENDYAEYVAETTYSVGNRCIVVATHKIYESLGDNNAGNYPPTDVLAAAPQWMEVSATNRWKAFDDKVGTQSTQSSSITYQITPAQVVDSIAFLNLDAATIQVVMTDPTDGEVYNRVFDLNTTTITGVSQITDWYTYFFSDTVRISDIARFDLPLYLSAVIDITISYPNETAKVGTIVLGLQTNLGGTQYGAKVALADYSKKSKDEYGVYSIVERDFSKTMDLSFFAKNEAISQIQRLLASLRATAVVWVAHESYEALIVYGFYKDFSIVIQYPDQSACNIAIEGLT